ncbi:MAG: carbohydrate ABC transporter permease [Anaerolineae bacterium]|nr:carbohydrate ABC transporter permease [Anaerolineales bacterium]MCQ3976559.1 carbohydrate ABC transporter permease [Anaerolineae bacterium]
MPRRPRLRLGTILLHATIIFFCLIIILPILWVFLMSIKSIPDAYTGKLWPDQFDFSHYNYVFEHIPSFWNNFTNSIIVTSATVFLTSVCAILAGYALVHLRLPGSALMVSLLVGTLFFPTRLVSLIGIFEIQHAVGLLNTRIGLILPYVTLNLAISILTMRSIFEQISPEIADAARIDGASSWRIFYEIMLPLIVNGIVVLVIVNFVTAWGEYLLAVTLTNDQSVRTLPVVLATTFGGFGEWAWPRIAAVYIMAILPGLIGFAIAQRWYMKGLTEGALKL